MNPLLAVLELKDFAVIAFIVIVFASTAAFRQRLNLLRIEHKLDALLKHHGVQLLSTEAQRLASDPHQKIAAIKLHRDQTGVSLAEAKSDIEDFSRQ